MIYYADRYSDMYYIMYYIMYTVVDNIIMSYNGIVLLYIYMVIILYLWDIMFIHCLVDIILACNAVISGKSIVNGFY